MMRPLAAAAALGVFLIASSVRADTGDTLLTFGYVLPVGFGAVATAVNGTYLAYADPAPRHWRWIGWVSGGIDIALGTTVFAVAHDRSEGVLLGSLALGIGAAAVLTATFVTEDIAVAAMPVPHGAAMTLAGCF